MQQKLDENRDKYNSVKASIYDIRQNNIMNNKVFSQKQRLDLYYHSESKEYVWANPKDWYKDKNKNEISFITNKQLVKSVEKALKYLKDHLGSIKPKDMSDERKIQINSINSEIEKLYKNDENDSTVIEAIGRKCEILYSYAQISDSEIATKKVFEYLANDEIKNHHKVIKHFDIVDERVLKITLINKQILKVKIRSEEMTTRKRVIKQPATRSLSKKIETQTRLLRVCAYARVSTDGDDQLSSYDLQVRYYQKLINDNPEWQFVRVFADEGISGTNTRLREEFNEMINHCKKGKIDLVITKSVSRFARNTVDCLQTCRSLKIWVLEFILRKRILTH